MNQSLLRRRRRAIPGSRPRLRFSPWAWAKLQFLRDRGPTEIGPFGISSRDDLLCVEDLQLPRQQCSPMTVSFDDAAVADFFDAQQVDQGRSPPQFARIWVHTHPGASAQPSSTDERTFERVFGSCDWALMFILARGGATYARLRLQCGFEVSLRRRTEVDYARPFAGSDPDRWDDEFRTAVVPDIDPCAAPPDSAQKVSPDGLTDVRVKRRRRPVFDRMAFEDADSVPDLGVRPCPDA